MDKSVLAAKGGPTPNCFVVTGFQLERYSNLVASRRGRHLRGSATRIPTTRTTRFAGLERHEPARPSWKILVWLEGPPLNGTCRWTCPRTASVTVFGASRTRPRRIALARHC
jgi:hypothetical protein